MPPTSLIADLYPLSPMQQGMLFHSLLSPQAGIYLPQVLLTLEGELDLPRFRQAWQQVVDQHPILRTGFQWEKREQPFQVVYRQAELPWQELDWRSLVLPDPSLLDPQAPLSRESWGEGDLSTHLGAFLTADRQQGFDLKTPPLTRLSLIRIDHQRYYLLWTQHHLILDGWSAALVLGDVFTAYAGMPLPTRPPYRQHIAWLQQQDHAAAQAFWTAQMRGLHEPTLLPLSQPSSTTPTSSTPTRPAWDEQHFSLVESTTATLKALAQQHHLTLNTWIQGAFALLLSRYTHRQDICFGATYAGRRQPGAEMMVGLLINTLPVRVSTASSSLIPWLQQLQAQQSVALQYDYCSLLDLQSWSEIPSGTPLFESLLVFENYPVEAGSIQSSALQIRQIQPVEWTSVPITLVVAGTDRLTFKLKFDRHRFAPDAMQRLLSHLHHLLDTMAIQPHLQLEDFSLLTPAEQQQLATWNQNPSADPLYCLPDGFEAQVERTPDAIAVVIEQPLEPENSSNSAPESSLVRSSPDVQNHLLDSHHLTYRELNDRANQLAHYLQSQGVQPESIVGIRAERSLDLVVSILAVVKAGAAYLPLDPELPLERLALIQQESQVDLVLPVQVDSTAPTTNPPRTLQLDHSVYVIYTSGSTGVPKGVINTHRGLMNRLNWMQSTYGLIATDRVLQKTPFSFDVSVWEFFWPLLHGACLVLAKPQGQQDSRYLARLVARQQITLIHFVPAMLQAFLDELASDPALTLPSLRHIFCSGEALPTALAARYFSPLHSNQLTARLHNLYGPTEAAIDVAFQEVTQPLPPTPTIPIGRPIHNIQLYILDGDLHPAPIGVSGELYIGGMGLARGYLHRPDLTAERFIPDPSGSRFPGSEQKQEQVLYRTGDLARYLLDGSIEYLGRLDHQVKLRGFRIELGEVEAALLRHPLVQAAVVMLYEPKPEEPRLGESRPEEPRPEEPKPEPTQNGLADLSHTQLVAYIVPQTMTSDIPETDTPELASEYLASTLTTFLQNHLPQYMIPSRFMMLSTLPLLPNGKLNRRALPAPHAVRRSLVLPRNAIETTIAAIWSEVLKKDPIGVHDPFFELGGNSLLATRINARLRQTFQLELPLQALFEKPTIAALAERITALQITRPITPSINQPITQSTSPSTSQPSPVTAGRKEIEL